MIQVDGLQPDLPLETTYIIDATFEKQMAFKEVDNKLKRMMQIMQGGDEDRFIEN